MKPLLFLHIPKTAGTSVLTYLSRVYHGRVALKLRWQDRSLQEAAAEEVARADFIWLHEPLHQVSFDRRRFYCFTVFRHPVDRVRSLFAYLRDPEIIAQQNFDHTPAHVVAALRTVEHMSFDDFVRSEDPTLRGHQRNVYSLYLGGPGQEAISSEERLRRSREALEKLDYIAMTDSLAADMEAIRATCFPGYPEPFGERRSNVSVRKDFDDRLGQEARGILESNLSEDLRLYDHARALRAYRGAARPPGGFQAALWCIRRSLSASFGKTA